MTSVSTRVASLASVFLASKSLLAAVIFGLGGIGFSVANLLLARFLPETEFGVFALFLALVQAALAIGPAGADLVINRRGLTPTVRLATSVTITGGIAATLICLAALRVYDVPGSLLPVFWIALFAASASRLGSAFFQSRNRIMAALSLTQSHNLILLAAVPLALMLDRLDIRFFLLIVAAGYAATAVLGWYMASRLDAEAPDRVSIAILWREGLAGLGIGLAALLLAQTERFVIPIALSYREMAEFAVLAAVSIAPFRMMQIAVGFTLLPRLRNAQSPDTARRYIRQEAGIAAAIGLAGAAAVLLLGPWIVRLFVGDKYEIATSLFVATIAVGWVRMGQSIAVATVNALGSTAQLAYLNGASWLALAVAAASAWQLADLGLVGIVIGVGIGWVVQAVTATVIGRLAIMRFDNSRLASAT